MVENGHLDLEPSALRSLAEVLDCSPALLTAGATSTFDRPKLRAYADASQRAVDSTTFDSIIAVEAISTAGLRALPVRLPVYHGDLSDDDGIDKIATDVRTAAGLASDVVVPNVIRSAERLGCVVLPLSQELSPRHFGMSLTVNGVPVVRVSRPSLDADYDVPGDRQRFTVAHELGHLVLHAGTKPPSNPAEAARTEREAHRFAAAFLVPGDAALEDLEKLGGRVTLSNLAIMKQKWGYSIKAFVLRFRELGVIDDAQARSLYKQISARRWNKEEPHRPGTETAIWLGRALREKFSGDERESLRTASEATGIGESYFQRWLDWHPSKPVRAAASVTVLQPRESTTKRPAGPGQVTRLPFRPDLRSFTS